MRHLMTRLLTPAPALGLFAGSAQAATILYSQTFSSTSTAGLNGTAVEGGTLSANWTANGTAIRQNGTTPTTAVNGSAVLPFTPVSGMIYTVTATVSSTNSSWGGIGFSNAAANWETTATDTRFTGGSVAGQPWMIHSTGGQSAFLGPKAANNPDGTLTSVVTGTVDLSVVLNTTDTAWTASFFVNGNPYGDTTAYGTNPTITAVGLTTTNGGTRDFSNFSLTSEVPEPGSLALLGLGGLLIARRRRS